MRWSFAIIAAGSKDYTFSSMTNRIFITGASGFVGANLARLLHERGYELRCLVSPKNPALGLASIPFERVDGRLEDLGVLEEAMQGMDMVVHLAALVSFSKRDKEAMFRINAEGSRHVASLARKAGVSRFLYMSSVLAVGHSTDQKPIDETASYNLARFKIAYCDSKRAGELAVLDEVKKGLDAVIVNPVSMFGAGDRRKAEGSLLEALAYDKIPFCPAGGLNVVDVQDVVQGSLHALEDGRTGERYILGGQNLRGKELFAKIASVLGKRAPRFTMPRSLARLLAVLATGFELLRPLTPPVTAAILRMTPLYFWYSSKKAEEELGYASYPIEMAIKAAFDWMLDLDLLDPSRVKALGRV